MSRRGHYPGGHTILTPYSSWFKNPLRKKRPKKNPRVKLKKKPRPPRKPKLSPDEQAWANARQWAQSVAPANVPKRLASDELTFLQREALLEVGRKLEEAGSLSAARRWADGIQDIPHALQRTTLTQAQREALIEVAVKRRQDAKRVAAKQRAAKRSVA